MFSVKANNNLVSEKEEEEKRHRYVSNCKNLEDETLKTNMLKRGQQKYFWEIAGVATITKNTLNVGKIVVQTWDLSEKCKEKLQILLKLGLPGMPKMQCEKSSSTT